MRVSYFIVMCIGVLNMGRTFEKLFLKLGLALVLFATQFVQTKYSSGMMMDKIVNVSQCKKSSDTLETAKPATREQQKEIAKYCYDQVKKYWDMRDIKYHVENESENSVSINKDYKVFLESTHSVDESTYGKKLDFEDKYYEKALGDSSVNWDCKVVAGHMAKFLKDNKIKHRYVTKLAADFSNDFPHDFIIYAVNENSKSDKNKTEEKWYVLDMELMRKAELSIRYYEVEDLSLFYRSSTQIYSPLKSPVDAACIPLELYAENEVFGLNSSVSVFVYGTDNNARIDSKYGIVIDAPLIGEWVYEHCTNDFKEKFLIMDVSDEEMMRINGNLRPDLSKLRSLSRRVLIREELPQPPVYRSYSLLFLHNGKLKKVNRAKIELYDGQYLGYLSKEMESFLKTKEADSVLVETNVSTV